MPFESKSEQKKNDMLERLKAILSAEAKLVSFDYEETIFGNIVVIIKVANTKHTFITDRGEIYHNGKMLCNSAYYYIEKEDTFPKLLNIIKMELGF